MYHILMEIKAVRYIRDIVLDSEKIIQISWCITVVKRH